MHQIAKATNIYQLIQSFPEVPKLTLIGEASHGTHEYYLLRAQMTKILIEKYNYNFIAVEGDWPDCFRLNEYVKGRSPHQDAISVLKTLERWPTWMWANWEVAGFLEWLREYNDDLSEPEKVGFYGMDLYSLNQSMQVIMNYLEKHDSETLIQAKRAYECFQPLGNEGDEYALSLRIVNQDCEQEVVDLLENIVHRIYENESYETDLNLKQNSIVLKNAEKYYRTMARGGEETWNIRDRHMMDTVSFLLRVHGTNSCGVLWAHNTHIGDARATSMSRRGLFNLGQLARQTYPQRTMSIGFGGYSGRVIASAGWGEPHQDFVIPNAIEDSWEHQLHQDYKADKILTSELESDTYNTNKGHRAIGVVYDPDLERFGNYVPTLLSKRYDSFIHLENTNALHPLKISEQYTSTPNLFPWGL